MAYETKTAIVNGITINYPASPLPTPERVAELDAAFKRVQNREHWKGAIDCVVEILTNGDLATILEAIEFYTATTGTVTPIGEIGKTTTFRVTAPGYWAGPAN